jgi:hypothetical protein
MRPRALALELRASCPRLFASAMRLQSLIDDILNRNAKRHEIAL